MSQGPSAAVDAASAEGDVGLASPAVPAVPRWAHRPLLPDRTEAARLLATLSDEERVQFVEDMLDAQWRADATGDPDHVSFVIQQWVVGAMFATDPNRAAQEERARELLAAARRRDGRTSEHPERTEPENQ